MNLVEVQKYLKANAQLRKDIESLDQSWQQIKIQFKDIKNSNAELKNSNAELKKENCILKEKIKELEYSKNLNSSNSSKPPSSDGLKKPKRTNSLRKKSNLKRGGQPGHKGHTLSQKEIPDEIIDIKIDECPDCKTNLSNIETDYINKRQEFDIDPSHLKVTEYRSHIKKCPKCKKKLRSQFPEKIRGRVQYGPLIQCLSSYLNNEQLLPIRRTSDQFRQTYESSLCSATVFNLNKRLDALLDPYLSEIKEYLKKSPVKHLDETGFRMCGKTSWLHSLSDKKATHYKSSEKRGDIHLGVENTAVHDNYVSYNKLNSADHALCNVHHMRELKALKEIEKESWAGNLYSLLDILRRKKNKGISNITKAYLGKMTKLYDKILTKGFTYHESKKELPRGKSRRKRHRRGHNLLRRLSKNKNSILRFIYEEKVPFSNNQAERDIRMMKLKQKISGGFRTSEGGEEFSRIKSIFSTLSKLGINILEGIKKIQNSELELGLIPP